MPKQAPIGRMVGGSIARARDAVARVLIWAGVGPNVLTCLGFLMTVAAGGCLAMGAGDDFGPSNGAGQSYWCLMAGCLLFGCAAMDMLDGAVARLGGRGSRFGAFLDSTLDRISDAAIWAGITLYYAQQGNLTFTLLSILAGTWAQMISYTKARAENMIESCSVGYWQRGERWAGLLISAFAYHIAAYTVLMAFSCAFTVLRRMLHTRRMLALAETGQVYSPQDEFRSWRRWMPWRRPRGSWPYDLITIFNICIVLFIDLPAYDLLNFSN